MSQPNATKDVEDAKQTIQQTGDTQSASAKLVEDAQKHFGSNGQGDESYLGEMSRKLVNDGLLPAVTLAYLDKNFDKADTIKRDEKLTKTEIRQFIDDNRNNRNGDRNTILDREMYQNLLKYMDENKLTTISKDQILKLREAEQAKFDKVRAAEQARFDKTQEAYYNARVLLNPNGRGESVLDRIKPFQPGQTSVDRQDLADFSRRQLDADPHWAETDEAKAIDWLVDNWNDPVVRTALMENGRIPKVRFKEKLDNLASANGLNTEGPVLFGPPVPPEIPATPVNPPANDAPVVVPPPPQQAVPGNGSNDSDQYPAFKRMNKDNRPIVEKEHGKHDWYFSDGKGNTIALDGKDKKDPDVITLGTISKNQDGTDKTSYTAWRRDKENNRWILYDYKTPIAIADKVEVDNKTGKVNIIGKYTPLATMAQGVM